MIEIWTDGSCLGNPGPGGWATLIRVDGAEKTLSGGEINATNNQMELLAAIRALQFFTNPQTITLTTDSNYVKNGITKWIENWKSNGWKTATKDPVKNQHLWQELDRVNTFHKVQWNWVKAHNTCAENNYVDQVARKCATEQQKLIS